jgi:hypothetical protein
LEIYLRWRRCFGASGFCVPVILIHRQRVLSGSVVSRTANAENIKGDNTMKQKSIYTKEEKDALLLAYQYTYDAYLKMKRARKGTYWDDALPWLIGRMKQMQSALMKIYHPEKIDFVEIKAKE